MRIREKKETRLGKEGPISQLSFTVYSLKGCGDMLARKVWTRSEETCWQRAEVTFGEGEKLTLYVEETDEVIQDVAASELCEIDPTHDADLKDIVTMNNLHEAPILHLLHRRLGEQQIYTWAGDDVLLSINPYHHVPLYGLEALAHAAEAKSDADEPHIYTLARRAHRDLLSSSQSHSIVISGESVRRMSFTPVGA